MLTEQEKIRKLAEWANIKLTPRVELWTDKSVEVKEWGIVGGGVWNPFTLDAQGLWAARQLEDEVERRGLQFKYAEELGEVICDDKDASFYNNWDIAHATPALKSEAVWRMIGGE